MIGPRLRAIIVKEMWAVLRDPRSRIILFVPPLLQFLLFGMATTLEVKHFTIGVLDLDSGFYSHEMIERVAASPDVRAVMRLGSDAALRRAIDHQRIIGALRFPSSFSADIARGGTGAIGAVYDGRRSNAAQIVASYVGTIAAGVAADIRPANGAPSGGVIVANRFNPNLDYRWFTMPGLIAIIGAISAMSVVAQSVARERELGTFDQLMVSPLRVHEILIGKMVPPIVVGTIIATIYVILIPNVFGVPLTGSLIGFYLALMLYLLALTGLGMLVSALSATQQQAFLGMFLVTVPMIILSGYATPVDNMPVWLRAVALVNPATHFLVVAEGVFLKGMPLSVVLLDAVPLAAIAAVTLAAAALLFRSRME
ncbi:ABC transporter permease [Hephaestia mangrovi]|uniref:ABC transporter permease n=1 Tax=Hephaestia mangrovi TaxID=2873268 RepID=UPI001CA72927|nr:ABC transporter permease [Hephaestia mangrovi]MBY8826546.1 ABC transporter permease [Hephaestia mangrovi]